MNSRFGSCLLAILSFINIWDSGRFRYEFEGYRNDAIPGGAQVLFLALTLRKDPWKF